MIHEGFNVAITKTKPTAQRFWRRTYFLAGRREVRCRAGFLDAGNDEMRRLRAADFSVHAI